MNSVKTVILSFLFFFACLPAIWAQNSFARGEELFMQNKPQEALPFLETAVTEDAAHVQAFIYLGIAYQQLNRLDKAIDVYNRILPRGGTQTARIAYNLGNVYFAMGDTVMARRFYTQAIDFDPSYASAYLNRANTLVKSGELLDAITDYEAFLSREPLSPKRNDITRLIAFIQEEYASAELRRLMEEEAIRAEQERRRRLLEEVSGSLQAAAEEAKALSAGSEDMQDFDSEFELD